MTSQEDIKEQQANEALWIERVKEMHFYPEKQIIIEEQAPYEWSIVPMARLSKDDFAHTWVKDPKCKTVDSETVSKLLFNY